MISRAQRVIRAVVVSGVYLPICASHSNTSSTQTLQAPSDHGAPGLHGVLPWLLTAVRRQQALHKVYHVGGVSDKDVQGPSREDVQALRRPYIVVTTAFTAYQSFYIAFASQVGCTMPGTSTTQLPRRDFEHGSPDCTLPIFHLSLTRS